MVTGDDINIAKAIATECGILTSGGVAIEGPQFRNLSTWQMEVIIPTIQVLISLLVLLISSLCEMLVSLSISHMLNMDAGAGTIATT